MPRISEFYGVSIYMYFSDHPPPHFHAIYGSYEAVIAVDSGKLLTGYLPRRARSLVEEWARKHHKELERDWQLARDHNPLDHIPPLE